MSLFSALTTSVAGLQAQSFAMENISDNIANARTTGYKRVESSFADLVTDGPPRLQQGGAVSFASRSTNALAGATTNTGVSTNVALSGPGFLTVRQKVQSATGRAEFSNTNLFTRRGDFTIDEDGYLVNGGGNYLVGRKLDPATGVPAGTIPDVIKIDGGFSPPHATSTLTYVGNLPATPQPASYDANVPGSDVWTDGSSAPTSVDATTTPAAASFASHSIDGQTVRLYDSVGNPKDVSLRWAKLSGGASPKWALYYESTPGATAAQSSWSLVTTATFDSTGSLTKPTGPVSVDMSSRGLGSVSIDLTGGHLTQYADQTGQAKISAVNQDGYAAGSFSGIQISKDGRINGLYSNGQTRPLAMMSIAQFAAPEALQRQSASAFAETPDSGTALFDAGATTVESGALEGSNTDISEEFSRMIVTQQAYSANTRVMSSAQDMLKEVMNVIR